MTLEEGVGEFLLSCEARNLRTGTIRHYQDSIKQIYKIVPKETLINEIDDNGCLIMDTDSVVGEDSRVVEYII